MKVLIIEDDRSTADYVAGGLKEEGHDLDHAASGPEGLELACTRDYDAVVIDRMLPGLDGLSIVRALRSAGRDAPIIFLTSVSGLDDRVEGLEAGADDYLAKPFAFSELMARLNALARRSPLRKEDAVLKVGDLEMNVIARQVRRQGQAIELQPREFRLLEYMMRNRGRVLTRTMLLERVWDFHFDPKTNVVETHVSRLRSKVDKPFETEMIRTIRGSGYILNVPS
ncbi:two-component system OmpR family response regulator [Rhodobium orientis]|uniref:DNA-binding response regulator n=1 Tax=Rhodobium orientis TaxID=34017 RepID=A0A327JIX1_9HYPH|nr:response regulator transcription factor [Rhodobium orientis]MBB4305271.1 two-component system OmpR family response regulator [Rhodobium orientis]MBK5949608.1 DNA-binding response regulator [Rhodobium orientis]RAI25163.1 DNA-binding response regulator [Rhodobium orientis]